MLDLVAAIFSGGRTTAAIDAQGKRSCGSCCQIFIVLSPCMADMASSLHDAVKGTIWYLREAVPAETGHPVYYPGERMLQVRAENGRLGIPVDGGVWATVCRLASLSTP